jgi:hypothetical protein
MTGAMFPLPQYLHGMHRDNFNLMVDKKNNSVVMGPWWCYCSFIAPHDPSSAAVLYMAVSE